MFSTGMLLTWEVVARYVFSAPTIWAAEISQMFLILGMYIALPQTIDRRKTNNIEMLYELVPGSPQRICELETIVYTVYFCVDVEVAADAYIRSPITGIPG